MTDTFVDTERERDKTEEKKNGSVRRTPSVRSHVLLFRSKQPLQEGVHARHDKWMTSEGTDDLTLIPNCSYNLIILDIFM